jgi:ABC-type transporter Mla subunit MlaD
LQTFYDLEVDFPNASGLLAGADVLLGGARIGYVAKPPRILPAMQGVAVELKILEEVGLPSASRFIIGSSGLLRSHCPVPSKGKRAHEPSNSRK